MNRVIRNCTCRVLSFVFAAALLLSTVPAAAAAPPPKLHKYSTAPRGMVCLTIDDGYGKADIERDLAVLKANGIHCSFFIIGSTLTKYADLWRQAVKDGHEICYHTMTHASLTKWSNKRIINDFNKWVATAHKVLGDNYVIPKFVRFPGGSGSSNSRLLRLFNDLGGYRVIYWNLDTYTGAYKKHKSVAEYIQRGTKAGAIILTHFRSFDSRAMQEYIGWLTKNFKVGTLTEAFAGSPPVSPAPVPTTTPASSTPVPTVAPMPTPVTTQTPMPTQTATPATTPAVTVTSEPTASPTATPLGALVTHTPASTPTTTPSATP